MAIHSPSSSKIIKNHSYLNLPIWQGSTMLVPYPHQVRDAGWIPVPATDGSKD